MRPISNCCRMLLALAVSLAMLCPIYCIGQNVVASSPELDSWKFTPIDFPDASYTVALDMNLVGQIVGIYEKILPDESFEYRGFLLSKGVFTQVSVGDYTEARGINSFGNIVGQYYNIVGEGLEGHGFLLHKGKVTQIDYPRADSVGTVAEAINDAGDIVGWYGVGNWDLGTYTEHGFLLRHGVYTTIDYPGAFVTNVRGINLQGDMVGLYSTGDYNGPYHGFLRRNNGKFFTIDYPGSDGNCNGINLLNQIVGEHHESGYAYGFLLSGGKFTPINIPGATMTRPWKITPLGQHIVGFYDDMHGFLLTRTSSH